MVWLCSQLFQPFQTKINDYKPYITKHFMGQLTQMLPLLMIMVVFYFFILRPQTKRQNDQVSFLAGIGKGDTVGTASGMIGKITAIDGSIITLEVDKNTFIKVTRASISKEVTESLNKNS